MVRTTHHRARAVLAGAALGALGVATGAVLFTGSPTTAQAEAQAETSTAYGVSAIGVDPVSAQPSVSSAGEVKTAGGDVSGEAGTFTASGVSVKAGAGMAEARVAGIKVGGVTFGPISAKCDNGVITYPEGEGPVNPAPNLSVEYKKGPGAVITIRGANGKASQTITAAVVNCAKGIPPTTTAPTTTRPTQPSTTTPTTTRPSSTAPTTTSTHATRPTTTAPSSRGTTRTPEPERPAPRPQPVDGHHPVTG
ncbi:hypothetical protein ALI22I_20060 [Saccharothrix sp. ALI-22-I]|uniref:TonB-dependent receptor n=1 Tax=Saccharothrix sp. ALI-22-I TaxID=1933778 RepID=UPI00097BFE68|nr:TonB-dependent receptor [Saccharothrix sp. ALI-22-I]ONI88040.1 hypothetical protein ALI22I_20060 [Saccharothrix sp. ALI-22-I]